MIGVLKQALEVLEYWDIHGGLNQPTEDAITSLRQAIAELESQEPVAWGVFEGNLHDMFFSQEEAQEMADLKGTPAEVRPLYTHPPQRTWVGLTNEEHMQLAEEWGCLSADWVFYAAAVERLVKEKNT